MSLQPTKVETLNNETGNTFPGFCEDHPDFREPDCEACTLEWNWAKQQTALAKAQCFQKFHKP